jgi:2-isopropylmalate synthase
VECTINGIGERAGNASLEEIVMAMRVRSDHYAFNTGVVGEQLFPSSQLLSEITGISVQPNKAITGRNAFAHEAGIHQDGMIKNPQTYEIMTPQSVGVPDSRLVLGKHSGRHALGLRCEKLGFPLERRELDELYRRFIRLADKVKTVEDHHVLELIHKSPDGVPQGSGGQAAQASGLGGREVPLLPDRFPPPTFTNRTVGRDSILLTPASEHEGEQEDYLWGV